MSIDEKALEKAWQYHTGTKMNYYNMKIMIESYEAEKEPCEAVESLKRLWEDERALRRAEEARNDQPVHISSDAKQEAITVIELVNILEQLPNDYTMHINVLGKVVCGITGAEDIGGDYFGQVFLTNFDHDSDVVNGLKAPKRESSWEDRTDIWSSEIPKAHPTLTGDHDTYEVALEMVSNRHGKGALVDLVNWLLWRINELHKAMGLDKGMEELGKALCDLPEGALSKIEVQTTEGK